MSDFFDSIAEDEINLECEDVIEEQPFFRFRVISTYDPYSDELGHSDNTRIIKMVISNRIKNLAFKKSEIYWFDIQSWVGSTYFTDFIFHTTYREPVVTEIKMRASFGCVSDVLMFLNAINIYSNSCVYESFIGFVTESDVKNSKWNDKMNTNTFRWPVEYNIYNAMQKSDWNEKVRQGLVRDIKQSPSSMENFILTYKYQMSVFIAKWCDDLIDRNSEKDGECVDSKSAHKERKYEIRKLIDAFDNNFLKHTVELHNEMTTSFSMYKGINFPNSMSMSPVGIFVINPENYVDNKENCKLYRCDNDAISDADKKELDAVINDCTTYHGGFLKLLESPIVCSEFDYSDKTVLMTIGIHFVPDNNISIKGTDHLSQSAKKTMKSIRSCYSDNMINNQNFDMTAIHKWNGFHKRNEEYPDYIKSIIENTKQISSKRNRGNAAYSVYKYYPEDKMLDISLRLGEIYDPERHHLYVVTIGLFGNINKVIESIKILNTNVV